MPARGASPLQRASDEKRICKPEMRVAREARITIGVGLRRSGRRASGAQASTTQQSRDVYACPQQGPLSSLAHLFGCPPISGLW